MSNMELWYTENQTNNVNFSMKLNSLFPICEAYQYHIPTYPSGHWMFCFASKTLHPIKDLDAAYWNSLGLETKYYNTDLHVGCFALPNYVKAQLIEE